MDVTEGILTNFETISGGYSESDIEIPNCDIDNKFHNIFHDYWEEKLWLVFNKSSIGFGERDIALSQIHLLYKFWKNCEICCL